MKGNTCKKYKIAWVWNKKYGCQLNTPATAHGAAPAASGTSTAGPSVEVVDFLVLGSGIAGLSYALKVAEYGRVALVTKAGAAEGCTAYAQGGICAVLDQQDSVEAHAHDTMVAGAWLNDRNAVDVVCREGPRYVLELARFGAEFTRGAGGALHLTREGGHSARRIVHAADATGAEIERALVSAAAAHPNISFFEHHLAVDLLVDEVDGNRYCLGADVLDQQEARMTRFVAPVTMLATGGAGQVYPNTTNPGVTTGDGIAMAYRAKAAVANMEFVQFHPTSLFAPATPAVAAGAARAKLAGGRSFLITEAVRGEGGRLFNLGGERFMPRYDERLELAPRDIVARAIQAEMVGRGDSHVLLDISHKSSAEVLAHFPNVAAHCASLGVDITQEPIPVVPAQHYLCGGVQTGLLGETHLLGLYACGEVACSGLHGANRLASNSLLEGLVFANRAVGPSVAHAEHALRCAGGALRAAARAAAGDFSGPRAPRPLTPSAAAWVAAKRGELTEAMWRAAGIVRRQDDMKRALAKIAALYVETRTLAQSYGVSTELVELRNLVTVGELILSSALQRRESRGGHYCVDFPEAVPQECRATVISTPPKARLGLDLSKPLVTGVLLESKPFAGAAAPSSPKRDWLAQLQARHLSTRAAAALLSGMTALAVACRLGHVQCARELVAAGADANAVGQVPPYHLKPFTPLSAVMLSSTTSGGPSAPAAAALLQLLLAAGADPLAASVRRRCSTLRCACGSEFLRSLPPLLDHLEGRLAAGGLALGTGDAAAEVLVGAARFCRLQLWRVAHEFVLAASGRRPTLAPAGGAVPHRGRRAIDSSSSSDDEGGAGEAEVSSGSRPANEASGGSGSSGGGCGGAGGASGDSLEGALEWLARAAPPRWQPTQQQLFEVLRSAALGGSVDIIRAILNSPLPFDVAAADAVGKGLMAHSAAHGGSAAAVAVPYGAGARVSMERLLYVLEKTHAAAPVAALLACQRPAVPEDPILKAGGVVSFTCPVHRLLHAWKRASRGPLPVGPVVCREYMLLLETLLAAGYRPTVFEGLEGRRPTFIMHRGVPIQLGERFDPWDVFPADTAADRRLMLVAQSGGWGPAAHADWPQAFKAATRCLLLAAHRQARDGGAAANAHGGADGRAARAARRAQGKASRLQGPAAAEARLGSLPSELLQQVVAVAAFPVSAWM
ncbi:L-aspartate oxidase [Micractinium conductrix]|uniref:L-aspartate oxidase n=1 Tax=Micractinium conductrix TaxID=554055 RepID=A0A2P6V4L3_9CHLO|nr:L-aspartate oxidase [Micractinium conductrix]|eukprot:PSC69033.1 L-aspartate oxidase [Micractinium conductrix]